MIHFMESFQVLKRLSHALSFTRPIQFVILGAHAWNSLSKP